MSVEIVQSAQIAKIVQNEKILTVDARVGEEIRFWMYRRGVKQPEIAQALGLSVASVSKKMAGKVSWSVTDLAKAAALLNVSIDELIPADAIEIARAMSTKSAPCGARTHDQRARIFSNFNVVNNRKPHWIYEPFTKVADPFGMAKACK